MCSSSLFLLLLHSGAFSSAPSSLFPSSCLLQGQFHLNGMHKAGDLILGGLFQVHFFSVFPDQSFTAEPQQLTCHSFDFLGFRKAQTMAFAIDEINRDHQLLPNVTLGYSLYDSCLTLGVGFRAALALVSGQEEHIVLNETCEGAPPVVGLVGDSSSTRTIAISTVLGLYRVPMVSYFATCACLSDRQRFPSFFRTIPSDAFQVRAVLQILKHFGWTWAGLLISDDDYGLDAARSFNSDLGVSAGGCLAYVEILPWEKDVDEFKRIVDVMRKSTARVVVVFAHEGMIINLMEEANQFWEFTFQCKFSPAPSGWVENGGRICSGDEDLKAVETEFLDVSDLRSEYNVYKAVYALAYALDELLRCEPGKGPFSEESCATLQTLHPWQGQFHLNGMHKAGDLILGGLFQVHFFSVFPDQSFTAEPQQLTCHSFDLLGFRQAQTMAFAIDEINKNSQLLPDVTLGYSLHDNCLTLGVGFRAALALVGGQEEHIVLNETCEGAPPVVGLVGDSSSTRTIAISTVLGLYRVPMVSYFATCACLSDRQRFPSFFRTIPSDAFQCSPEVRHEVRGLEHGSCGPGFTGQPLEACQSTPSGGQREKRQTVKPVTSSMRLITWLSCANTTTTRAVDAFITSTILLSSGGSLPHGNTSM
ncbi:hypothetical protein CCH79_00010356 [Gambusia affinis]|uniref:Receptor ligand binding region domain-containing protein n=1 Tax=Gambusia affinis TaxID=33528 RepID=A0A315VFS2_GAMAF|nr:hypothetical protein CCH79_00010356 [Gambusia affinis]